MSKDLHTVLGAAGGIGKAVIQELKNKNLPVRAVGRNINMPDVENVKADALKKEDALRAIEGSTYVHLCIGLPYKASVWKDQWPLLMQNVIDACAETGAKLIFLDNIYMYGPAPLAVPFDEDHAQEPISKKGIARKATADKMVQAMEEGKIKGLIARAADIYGPHSTNSVLYVSFLERMMQGKAPQSVAEANVKHTYVNTTDIGKAMVLLALDESAYGQVWHLPVSPPVTIEEMTDLFNKALGTSFKVSFLPSFMRKLLGIFLPVLKEVEEMRYQFETPYVMSFEKFKKQYPDFQVSSYEEGIKSMIESFK